MTTADPLTDARRRAEWLVDEGARLLARGAGHDELADWNVRQHGLWKIMRPVDPALATRLRSVKLRVGAVIRAHYRSAASRPAACTHRCPVHCPGAR